MKWMKHIALVLAVVAMTVGPGCTSGSFLADWSSHSKEPNLGSPKKGGTKATFTFSAGIDYDHDSTKYAIGQFYDLVMTTFKPIVGLFVPGNPAPDT